MAKKKMSITVKGLLDLNNFEITEFLKDDKEVLHNLKSLLSSFDGLDNVSISVSQDVDIK